MNLPDAAFLRQQAIELEELETSLAKRITKALEKDLKSIQLDLTYEDGSLTYFGANKDKTISLLESKNYKVEIIPEKVLSGGFEKYPEQLRIDWS